MPLFAGAVGSGFAGCASAWLLHRLRLVATAASCIAGLHPARPRGVPSGTPVALLEAWVVLNRRPPNTGKVHSWPAQQVRVPERSERSPSGDAE